ncbi:beta strand repeat-containing protein, partial [Mycobacterium paragordonae]|uniref:beta strand repeat-containing protein n=1 Tax=Mycobacterium paragordonae TaxID=1389713 RepID=UPI00140D70CD
AFGLPTVNDVATLLSNQANDFATFLAATGQATFAALGAALQALIDFLTAIPANLLSGAMPTTVTLSGTQLGTLLQYINSSGQFAAAQLTGALNTGLTFSGTALSTLFQYLNSSGQFSAAQLTGGINTAVTFGGTQLGTLLQYLSSSGQFNAAQLTGGLNSAVTFGGTALSTFFGNINSTGGLLASGLTGAFNGAVTLGGNSFTNLLQYLNSSGQFAAGQLTGAINGGLTLGGVTLSTLVTNINSSGQILAAGITGALGTGLTVGGVTLSTLFTNINSAGQLLGPGITGAINTAATVAGTAIGTVATNANAAVTNINSLISNVGGSVIADVNTFINTASTNAQGSLNAIVNGINNSAVTNQTISQAQTAVNNFISGVVNNLQGIAGTFGLTGATSANGAFAAAAAAQAQQAAQLAQQQSAFNAVFNVSPATAGNVNQTIDFTVLSNQSGMSGIMLPGTGAGAGYMGVTSGEAKWQGTSTGDDTEVFPTATTSDYQVVTATLGSLNDVLNNSVRLHLIGRSNSSRDTYVSLHLNYNGTNLVAYLNAIVSNTSTPLSNNTLTVATGGVVKLILGDPSSSSPYAMQVLYNGTPLITYTDSSHVSQLGDSYRYTGLRMAASSTNKIPPAVRTVNYQDNPPAPASYPFSGTPTVGTKGRMYVSNDVGLIQRDNGSAWEYVWGGPLGYLTKPPSSSWSWVNQGTASTASELGGERITAPSSTRNFRLRTRTLTPSSNYSAVAYVEAAGVPVGGSNLWLGGIGLRNSSSQSFISFGPYLDNTTYYSALAVYRWTNATTISANSFAKPVYQLAGGAIPNWYRIRDDGTNRYFDYSTNGVDWITVFSEGRTAFITPDQFCFGFDNEGSGADCIIRLRSLSGIS